MPAEAEREVRDDVARRGREDLEHLGDEDRHVRAGGRAPARADVRGLLGVARRVALLVLLAERARMGPAVAGPARRPRGRVGCVLARGRVGVHARCASYAFFTQRKPMFSNLSFAPASRRRSARRTVTGSL